MESVDVILKNEMTFFEEMSLKGWTITKRSAPVNSAGEVVYRGTSELTGKEWLVVPREDCTEMYDEFSWYDYAPWSDVARLRIL
jgi:hypothetical protein